MPHLERHTGQRLRRYRPLVDADRAAPREIGGLRWSEIDLETGAIHLPAERTKNGKAHMVPLSKPARAILQSRPRLAGRDHVFGLGEGFSGWSASKAALDASLPKLADWTLHDLRRTAVTSMAELGTAPHVIEAVVNHLSGTKGGIAGVYNRANHYNERREALELWAKHLMSLVAGRKSGRAA